MRLLNHVVVVTGASRGVGAAVAVACARQGAHVALAAKTVDPNPRLPGTLGEVADRVRAFGREALVVPTDVRDEAQVEAMIGRTAEVFGRIDALINNAGAIHVSPVGSFPTRRFDLVMGINVRASFLATRAALPWLRKQGGHVVMMSPPVHLAAAAGKAPYLVSKIGMTMLAAAVDGEESDVAGHALWPVTGIRSAATENLGFGTAKDWRTPEILADATVALIARDPRACAFRAWLDEEVLREIEGRTDFGCYRCDPEHEPAPWSIQLVDPSWQR
jgi:citronellol/citronellal dehydrogenase